MGGIAKADAVVIGRSVGSEAPFSLAIDGVVFELDR